MQINFHFYFCYWFNNRFIHLRSKEKLEDCARYREKHEYNWVLTCMRFIRLYNWNTETLKSVEATMRNDDEHDNCFTSDTASRRFIVKAMSLVYHHYLIARRMMVIVGDVVSEIDDWSVFRVILRSMQRGKREREAEEQRGRRAHQWKRIKRFIERKIQ
jgi:hypothetical protein